MNTVERWTVHPGSAELPVPHPGDVTGDGIVNIDDLLTSSTLGRARRTVLADMITNRRQHRRPADVITHWDRHRPTRICSGAEFQSHLRSGSVVRIQPHEIVDTGGFT